MDKVYQAAAYQSSQPDSAFILAREVLEDSKEIAYYKGVAYAYVRLGSLYNLEGENDSAEYYLDKAVHIRERLNDLSGAASVIRLLGNIYEETGRPDSALSAFIESARMLEKTEDTSLLIISYLQIAHFLMDFGDPEEALNYYQRSENLSVLSKDTTSLALSYQGLGKYYHDLSQSEKSLSYFLKAADILESGNNLIEQSNNYINIASSFNELEQYDKAIRYFKDALKIAIDLNAASNIIMCYHNLGASFYNNGQVDSSLAYYKSALEIGQSIGDLENQMKDEYELATVYIEKKNFKEALFHYEKYVEIKDSLVNADKIASIAEMKTRFDTERKIQQIKLLEQENKIKAAQQKLLLTSSIIIVVILLALVIVFIQRQRIAKRNIKIAQQEMESVLDEQEIKTYNAMLEGQEEERMRIATDLHDRLGSMLSTIKLMFNSLEDKIDNAQKDNHEKYTKATSMLDEACTEVRRISHNLGSGMVANFGLIRAVEDLCDSINQSGKIECELISFNMEESIKLNVEVTLYRILQEALNNVIKHAKATKVVVQLNKRDDALSLSIEDNGIGFNTEEKISSEGMGLGNLKKRTDKIGGNLIIDSFPGKGTTIIVEIPTT